MRSKTILNFLGAIAIVVLYNLFFHRVNLGFSVPLFVILANSYLFITRSDKLSTSIPGIKSSLIAVITSLFFVVRDNGLVQFLNLLVSLAGTFAGAYYFHELGEFAFGFESFFKTPFVAARRFLLNFIFIFNPKQWPTNRISRDTMTAVIRGGLIALVLLFILAHLLTSADPVFNRLMSTALNEAGERLLISTILFVGLLTLIVKDYRRTIEKSLSIVLQTKSVELSLIVGSIAILFAIFIVIQFRYLFSSMGERELAHVGIASLTYSEYVRKGFFELLMAATIACAAVVYTLQSLHRLGGRGKQFTQLLSTVVTVETGLLLLSALKRVNLYTLEHGLTRARVFGLIFLLWLALVLVWLLVRVVKNISAKTSFLTIVPATIAVFSLITLINIDGLIVTKYPPTVNGEVDHFYTTHLSDDAYVSWLPAIHSVKAAVATIEQKQELDTEDNRQLFWALNTTVELQQKTERLVMQYGTIDDIIAWIPEGTPAAWLSELRDTKNPVVIPEYVQSERRFMSQNLSEREAFRYVKANFAEFKTLPALTNKIAQLDMKVTEAVRQNTPRDRTTTPPLMR